MEFYIRPTNDANLTEVKIVGTDEELRDIYNEIREIGPHAPADSDIENVARALARKIKEKRETAGGGSEERPKSYQISAEMLTATIEALLDLKRRYGADACALARTGGALAEGLAEERLQQHTETERLVDFYLSL